jgi:hypothetical protein
MSYHWKRKSELFGIKCKTSPSFMSSWPCGIPTSTARKPLLSCRSIKRHQEWFKIDAKLAGVEGEIMSIIHA